MFLGQIKIKQTGFAVGEHIPYQIEHLFANKPERHRKEVPDPLQFRSLRNQLGGLVLLPNSDNASLGAMPLDEKVKRYGGLSHPVRLLVYYGQAALYNTPYHGPNTELVDVAMIAARAVVTQTTFEKIYVLGGLRDGGEAYEIFPGLTRCT